MKRLPSLIVLLLLLVPVFAAPDIAGKWSGSFQALRPDGGRSADDKIFMTFTQKDAEVSGTAGPTAELQQPIRNGKMSGDKLAFEITTAYRVVVLFALTLTDGHLKGGASGEFNGTKLTATVDATRGITRAR